MRGVHRAAPSRKSRSISRRERGDRPLPPCLKPGGRGTRYSRAADLEADTEDEESLALPRARGCPELKAAAAICCVATGLVVLLVSVVHLDRWEDSAASTLREGQSMLDALLAVGPISTTVRVSYATGRPPLPPPPIHCSLLCPTGSPGASESAQAVLQAQQPPVIEPRAAAASPPPPPPLARRAKSSPLPCPPSSPPTSRPPPSPHSPRSPRPRAPAAVPAVAAPSPAPLLPPPPLQKRPPPSPEPASPPPPAISFWEMYEAKNCWWDGHGAEEVDSPKGSHVAGVTTVDECKTSCLTSANLCDGVLFEVGTRKCFRKASVSPALCSTDAKFTLYLRTDPNRPPSTPRAVAQSGMLNSASCSAMMRNRHHKFYSLWAAQGWSNRHPGEAACWDVNWADDWFDWVGGGRNCNQNWGNNLNAPTVFGFAESMTEFCNERGGGNNGDPGGACMRAHFNILRIGDWNMCRNVEWMICVVQGKACWGGGGSGEIIFTMAPNMLDIDDFNSRPDSYIENDIYYLEVCVLNEMCSNHKEIFEKNAGESFFCKFDPVRWAAAGKVLRQL